MDRITKFQQAIIAVMDEYITDHAHSRSLKDLKYEKLMDLNNHHYQLILLGWKDGRHIFDPIFHVDIINDKIWIQEDGLEYSVAERLGDNGIGKKDIVLAYFSASHRQYTEYAVY